MAEILFITHPEVVIDPAVPVPDWPLNALGRRRIGAFAEALAAGADVTAVHASTERKAVDGGEIIAARLGLAVRQMHELGENDRSATGYVAPPEFWEIVAAFFGNPTESVRGWERAIDAQDRIVQAMARIAREEATTGDIVVVSHGGVGRLLMAHLQGVPIGAEDKPSNPGGGCYFAIDRAGFRLASGWHDIDGGLAHR